MKLTTKTLWLPVAILLIIFIAMGSIFSWMITRHTDETIVHELTQLLSGEKENLALGLSLITSTQGPSDAIVGLEDDDDELAQDLVKKVTNIGLDAIYITDMTGKQLFSTKGNMHKELSKITATAKKTLGSVGYLAVEGNMAAFAPIYDVDTPIGFLFFVVELNESLFTYANETADDENDLVLASERLAETEKILEQQSSDFLSLILLTIFITLAVSLGIMIVVMGSTSRNIINPIKDLLVLLNKMASGDFTQRAIPKGGDELAQLQKAVNTTSEHLHSMIVELSGATEELSSSAIQISKIILISHKAPLLF
jgi:methyl-accepting chemotaxis protein